jgi:hypothetical protein
LAGLEVTQADLAATLSLRSELVSVGRFFPLRSTESTAAHVDPHPAARLSCRGGAATAPDSAPPPIGVPRQHANAQDSHG